MATAVPTSTDPRPPVTIPVPPKTSSFESLLIAVLGAAVMIDLAIETFLGGSTFRWWIVGAALLYIGATVLTRRMNVRWNLQFTIVLIFVLGVAAASVWLPGGLADGIRLAGQSTSRVLAGITAAALVVAMVMILRATVVPLTVRLVISLFALYGLSAFALGAWQRTAFSALFAGESFWHVLPRWLQGGILGALIVLPLTLIVALCGGLMRGKRSWSPQVVVVLVATIAIAAAAFRSPGTEQSANLLSNAVPPDPQVLANVSTVLKRVADSPEPTTFSVERTADQIGNDPASMFAYVHDHVRTQIYSGVLRGAQGTLMGGAGNAWDQSLLLAAMLRHHGREVRFAHAHLAPDLAAKIVDRMFTDAQRPRTASAQPAQIPDSLQKGSSERLAQILKDWKSARADLLKALDRANVSLGDAAISEQALESEAADHLFVEYHDGDRWIALDPVATDAAGTAIAPDGDSFAEVPDSFYHHVTIRVWIEERHNQQVQQAEALRFPTTAAALNGVQVLLSHRFDHDIAGGWRARPVLQIGDQAYGARSFSDAGLMTGSSNSKEDLISQAHQAVGQLGQVTDAFGGNSKAPAPAAAPEGGFSAETLEVEFTDPAKHSEVVRREMVDRIGPVARASNTAGTAPLNPMTIGNGVPVELAGVYALAFAAGPLNPTLPFRRLSSTERMIEDDAALRHVRPSQMASLSSDDQQRAQRVQNNFPVLLQTSAESVLALSQHVAKGSRMRGVPVLFYESSPRLVIASFDLTRGLALDLRKDTLRGVARKLSASDLVRANVARGVADAVIEADVLSAKVAPGRIAGVSIFDEARTQGIRLVTARSGAPVLVQASDLARARMASAEPGRVLIAPERTPSTNPSHFAWWKLDPTTGEAISVLDTGLNGFQDLPEDAVIETRVVSPMATTLGAGSGAFANTLPAFGIAQGFGDQIFVGVIEALVEIGEDINLDLFGDFY